MLKQKLSSNYLILAVGIGLLIALLTVLLLLLAYQNYSEQFQRNRIYQEIGEDIRSRVKIGEDREEALQAMVNAGAWSSIKCGELEKDVIVDYHYFGPKDRDEAFVWMTRSVYQDGRYVVEFIGNNSDSLTNIPELCLPPDFN